MSLALSETLKTGFVASRPILLFMYNDIMSSLNLAEISSLWSNIIYRRVAEIQIFEKTYLIVIKNETGLKFKMNDSTLFLIGSYAQKLVASY